MWVPGIKLPSPALQSKDPVLSHTVLFRHGLSVVLSMLRMTGESSHLLYGSQNRNPSVLSNFSGLIDNASCEAVGPEASEVCQEGHVLAFGADYI